MSANDRGDRIKNAECMMRGTWRANGKIRKHLRPFSDTTGDLLTSTVRPEVSQRPRRFIAYASVAQYVDYYWIYELKDWNGDNWNWTRKFINMPRNIAILLICRIFKDIDITKLESTKIISIRTSAVIPLILFFFSRTNSSLHKKNLHSLHNALASRVTVV